MAFISPIPAGDTLIIRSVLVYYKPEGEDYYTEQGIFDALTLEWEVEEKEKYDQRTGVRLLADSRITQVSGNVSGTLAMMTDLNRALAAGSDLAYEVQASGTHTVTKTGVKVGGIYQLPHVSVSSVTVTDGAATPVSYASSDIEVDAEAGLVKILSKPAGADDDIEISYTAAAITEEDGRAMFGLASNMNMRGSLILRSTNAGVKSYVKLHSVQLRPDGAIEYVGEDYATVKLKGKIFSDTTQPAGYTYGYEKTL